MWDIGSLKKGMDRCWVNWAWLTAPYLGHYYKPICAQVLAVYLLFLPFRVMFMELAQEDLSAH